jgi:hypothetical protein
VIVNAPAGSRNIVPGHRLYDFVGDLTILVDAFLLAAEDVYEIPHRKPFQNDYASLESKLFPILVRLPVGGPIYAALKMPGQKATYQISFVPYQPGPQGPMTNALANIWQWAFSALLVLLYERNVPWIKSKFGTETNNWPQLWRFAWAMRNAAAHNAGRFNMRDSSRPPSSGIHCHTTTVTTVPKSWGQTCRPQTS